MKQMIKIRTKCILLAGLVGRAFCCYKLLLNDEAKRSINDGVKSISRAYKEVKKALDEKYGVVMEDDQELPNVAATKKEWETLGY